MNSSMSENGHAISKMQKVVDILMKGKETTILLQTRLRDPVEGHGLVLVQEFMSEILGSFDESISELSSCSDSADSVQIAAVDGGGSACSGESNKRLAGVKDRRGCYKRRRTAHTWIKNSATTEDDFAWRKYGQKTILNSEYPRCYFRCTHKDKGCKALKQVQKIKDDPIIYQTTYINDHTCMDILGAPPLLSDDHYSDPPINLLSFQANHHNPKFEQGNTSKNSMIVSNPVKKEEELIEDNQSTDLSETKSSLFDPFEDIMIGSGSVGYRPIWDPMMSSYQELGSDFHHSNNGSTSLHGFESFEYEVNQLEDIDNFNFGEL